MNQTFVDRYLKGMDPLRQRVRMNKVMPGANRLGVMTELQIVGVMHDVLRADRAEASPELDTPFAQLPEPDINVAVRTSLDPNTMLNAVAAAVHSVDPELALDYVRTLGEIKQEVLGEDRFTVRLFSAFAVLALVLAALGIHGLIAYSVSQRIQEFGLRLALGASRGHVLGLVLQEALQLAAMGLLLGLFGAFAVGRLMQTALYHVGLINPTVTLAVIVVLLATAILAALLPARRAAYTDPMQALRTE